MAKLITKYHKTNIAALVLIIVGVMVGWQSVQYGLGSLSRMGSGFFPLVLGILLVLFAVMLWWHDNTDCELGADSSTFRSVVLTLLGFVAIALLIERWGMAPAVIIAVPFFCYADRKRSLRTVMPIVIGILVLCYTIFIWLLEMNIAFW